MAKNKEKLDPNKEMEKKDEKSKDRAKERENFKNQVKQESVSRGGRAGLKEQIKDADEAPHRKRKRRPRHRRKPKAPEGADFAKEQKKEEIKDKAKEEVLPEKVEGAAPKVEEASPAPPVAPINPFADTSLPPQKYEERYAEHEEGKEKKDVEKEQKEIIDEGVFRSEKKEDVLPINPFEPVVPHKPLDDKILDEKPLDEITEHELDTDIKPEEEESAEDMGQSTEVQSSEVEEVPTDSGTEDEQEGPQEQEEVKSEDTVIDVEPEPGEPVPGEPVPGHTEPINQAKEIEEFKEEFWDVLEQAGITKKRLFGFLIFLVVAIFVVLFFVFDWFGGDNLPDTQVPAAVSEDASEVDVKGKSYDIVASYIFGLEHKPLEAEPIVSWADVSGISAAFVFGQIIDLQQQKFVEYMDLLRKLQNIYDIDIYSLVNLAVDRRGALDEHLQLMDVFIKEAQSAVVSIDEDLSIFDAQYTLITTQRDAYEADFFTNVSLLQGQNAYDLLELFQQASQESIKIKTNYSAISTLRQMFLNSLGVLIPRYNDILANKEALIKGVRVFDVPGSDIDAIIPLQ